MPARLTAASLVLLALAAAVPVGACAPAARSREPRDHAASPPALRLLLESSDNDYAPRWSPDGTEIVFFSWRAGTRDLWVVDSAGGEPVHLDTGPGNDQYACWSPDGERIAYTTHAPGTNDQEILVIPRGGGAPRPLIENPGEDYHASWSPDGARLLFTSSRLGTPDIWITEVDRPDSSRLLIGGPSAEGYASWSPSGDRIAFQSERGGGLGIWIVDYRDGVVSEPRPISLGETRRSNATWSPRGDAIALVLWEPGRRRLAVVSVVAERMAEPRVVPLPDSLATISYPDWSPDGRSIAFSAYARGVSNLWVVSDPEGFASYQERDLPKRK